MRYQRLCNRRYQRKYSFAAQKNKSQTSQLVASTPENTRKKVNWAVRMFRDWHTYRLVITTEGELNVLKDIDEMDALYMNFCPQKIVCDIPGTEEER